MRYVIIGAGAAGIEAARELRARDKSGEIVILAKDEAPHSRCMLHKFLSGERNTKGLSFTEDDFFGKHNITLKPNTEVKKVDTAAHTVETSAGAEKYDKLLIATGAVFGIPPIPHFREAPNVHGFRDLIDAKRMSEAVDALKGEKRAFIVGSGLVGLDVAYALIERGVKVTIAEMADRVLPLQTDATSAAAYQRLFEKAGAEFRLGIGAKDAEVGADGNITAVILSNGERVPCGFVVCAAGVRPNIAFLEGSGIKTDRGVEVDGDMRTSAPDVWAAGDVTALSGIWPNARAMGRAAAASMAGASAPYDDRFCIKNTINFFGLAMLSLGDTAPKDDSYQVFTRECRDRYEKVIMKDGVVTGVQLQGEIANSGFWQYIIKNRINVADIIAKKSVFNLGYEDFWKLSANGEYEYAR